MESDDLIHIIWLTTSAFFTCTGEFEALSEDDLDLVEQNTGVRIARPEGVRLHVLNMQTPELGTDASV